MKTKLIVISLVVLIAASLFSIKSITNSPEKAPSYKATFIELGSVRCIPCQKMEPVLEQLRKEYPKDLKVIFYDVWTEAGKPYATQYGIKSIPTQVFLDNNGKEYYRHVGYFPYDEVVKILKQKNVKQ